MQRYNPDDKDKIIVFAAIICDIIIINIVYFSMAIICGLDEMLINRSMLLNICYILSIPLGRVSITIAKRRARIDQIVATSLKSSLYFIFIWCLMLSFSKFLVAPPQFYIICFVIISFLMIGMRLIVRKTVNHLRNKGRNLCHVVFIGARPCMIDLYNEMAPDKNAGYKIGGYFDVNPSENYPDECRYLGSVDMLSEYVKKNPIQRIYCGISSEQHDTIKSVVSFCESNLIRFFSVPNLSKIHNHRVSLEMVNYVPILSIRQEPLAKIENRTIKRTFDIIFSFTFLTTAFPIIFIILGIIIKLDSKGPIFFKQKRNGIDGREFWCYKFRSMRVNVNADKLQATKDDPRKTKIGEFMRRTNIDELPQFLNVLWGDMSIVGPRPHMLKHTEEYSELIGEYMVRHFIKPGVTGWAQITGYRGETKTVAEMAGRVKADIWYMEHWNFMLDLYIIYRTIRTTFIHDEKAF